MKKDETQKYELCQIAERNWILMREQIGGGFAHVATLRSEYHARRLLKLVRGEKVD